MRWERVAAAMVKAVPASLAAVVAFSAAILMAGEGPCIRLESPGNLAAAGRATVVAADGGVLGVAALEPRGTGLDACATFSAATDEPSYLVGDGWVTAPFLWNTERTVEVLPSARLRLSVRAEHGAPGRAWVKLLPEEETSHGRTLRYLAEWEGDVVEAVLPAGTWRAVVIFESSGPLPLGTVKLSAQQPTVLPGATVSPGDHLIVEFEPDRGAAIPPTPGCWCGQLPRRTISGVRQRRAPWN